MEATVYLRTVLLVVVVSFVGCRTAKPSVPVRKFAVGCQQYEGCKFEVSIINRGHEDVWVEIPQCGFPCRVVADVTQGDEPVIPPLAAAGGRMKAIANSFRLVKASRGGYVTDESVLFHTFTAREFWLDEPTNGICTSVSPLRLSFTIRYIPLGQLGRLQSIDDVEVMLRSHTETCETYITKGTPIGGDNR